MTFKPSVYQQDIFNWVDTHSNQSLPGNLVVNAVAGSGKTTTAVKALGYIPQSFSAQFLAFNKHIAEELKTRLPVNVQASTYHSAGLALLKTEFGKGIQVDTDKIEKIIKSQRIFTDYQKYLMYPAKRLVGLCKSNLLEPSWGNLNDLAFHYDVDCKDNQEDVFYGVERIMKHSVEMTKVIDFDDMCYLPVKLGLNASWPADLIVVDELQDTNRVQTELIFLLINSESNVMGVADKFQSIYGFRGADVDAVPNMIERLSAETLPLSVSYRCPKAVVELVNRTFPHISFQASEFAIDGKVDETSYETFLSGVEPGDMVLCRCNAPLVQPVFNLIRRGIKAQIVGREIGSGLKALMKKMKCNTLSETLRKLNEYRMTEVGKLQIAEQFMKAQALDDKIETIFALADGCQTVAEVDSRIDEIFSDQVQGIAFSTVHKAKGLEAKHVYILAPELMPHPMAKKEWERQQEQNVLYVAVTRALDTLTMVNGVPR